MRRKRTKKLSVVIEVIAPVIPCGFGVVVGLDFLRHKWTWFWVNLVLGVALIGANGFLNIRRRAAIAASLRAIEEIAPLIAMLASQSMRQYGAVRALVGLPLPTRRNVAVVKK